MRAKTLLQLAVCAALALACCCAEPAVVANLTNCTIKHEGYSSEADLENILDTWLNDTLTYNSTACTAALQSLTACSTDGDNSSAAGLSSLRIQTGCCSSTCAAAVEQALIISGPGCYRTFLGALCDNTKYNSSLAQPLFSLTQRCLGLNATCASLDQPGTLLPAELEARTVNRTNTTADKDTKATDATKATAATNATEASKATEATEGTGGSSTASADSSRTKAAANSAETSSTGSTGSEGVDSTKTEPVVPVVPEPDSYRLMPQGDANNPDVFLATPEEIDMVVHGADGAHGRRMLSRRALRQSKH